MSILDDSWGHARLCLCGHPEHAHPSVRERLCPIAGCGCMRLRVGRVS